MAGRRGRLPEYFVLLQPTSPLRTAAHLTACVEQFCESGARSAISVTQPRESPYKALTEVSGMLCPLFEIEMLDAPRQTLPRTWAQNGAIYLTRTDDFLQTEQFFVPPVMAFVMNAESSVDIDTAFDLRVAEAVYAGAVHA